MLVLCDDVKRTVNMIAATRVSAWQALGVREGAADARV